MAESGYEVFWKEALSRIRLEVGEQDFSVWFGNLEYLKTESNALLIAVPSSFYRDQIKVRYQNQLETLLKELIGHDLTIEFEVKPQKKRENRSGPVESEGKEAVSGQEKKNTDVPEGKEDTQSPVRVKKNRHPQLVEDYTFERYVIGDNNSFAANAAMAIGKNPGTAYNPLLIYGGVGLGKTHLMQAIGNYIHEHSSAKIIYTTAESFTNEFIQSIHEDQSSKSAFKNKYRYVDILLIDDIHFLENKSETQAELFYTYEALYNAKKQIVFTCDRPVSELKNLTERLRSRFERGLNVDLQRPNYETRCAILKKKVEDSRIAISNEVIALIGEKVSTNIRDLEAALTKLIAYAKLVGNPISLGNAQQILRDFFASPRQANMSVELIQRVVAEYFSLSPNDLKGKKRAQNIVLPRQLSMYIARELTEYSTTEIGQAFGGRDHTTVMYSYKQIEERMRADPTLEPTIESLKRLVKEAGTRT
ncbi:MAG: chromosomal replication initiator protein DnaA [Treponema sp.]|jgi:chromosomal replication initiator protein|nr:chromosomal replication initiator protein DnaA [Treponema sp.]